jgi:hypothetical protein
MKNHDEERKQKRAKLEALDFQLNSVKFSCFEDIFRAHLLRSSEGQVLWIENRRTKQQFQIVLQKLSDYGPSGIPDEAVYAFVQYLCM